MAVGLALGRIFPDLNDQLHRVKIDQTSLPIAIGLLGMMYPVLAKVRYDRPGSVTADKPLVGSSLLAPIFSRGRLESGLQFASAVQVEAVERYRQGILTALAQVEDARSAGQRSAERARLLDAIVEEARLTARLANVRFIEGEEDLLSVLDAQTSLSDAEDAQVIGWQERLFSQISLYRSMGGYQPGTAEKRG